MLGFHHHPWSYGYLTHPLPCSLKSIIKTYMEKHINQFTSIKRKWR